MMSKDNTTNSLIIDSEYEDYIGLVKHSVRIKNVTPKEVIYKIGNALHEMSLEEFTNTFTRVIYE